MKDVLLKYADFLSTQAKQNEATQSLSLSELMDSYSNLEKREEIPLPISTFRKEIDDLPTTGAYIGRVNRLSSPDFGKIHFFNLINFSKLVTVFLY